MSLHGSQFTGFYNLFVQVFLDIVESVNLLMSSKGEETVFQSIFYDYFIFSISTSRLLQHSFFIGDFIFLD